MALRFFTVPFFSIVFTAGVICAVVCPEQAIDSHHKDSGECTKCISTHFLADSKISHQLIVCHVSSNAAHMLTPASIQLLPSCSPLLRAEMAVHSPRPSMTSVFRI